MKLFMNLALSFVISSSLGFVFISNMNTLYENWANQIINTFENDKVVDEYQALKYEKEKDSKINKSLHKYNLMPVYMP